MAISQALCSSNYQTIFAWYYKNHLQIESYLGANQQVLEDLWIIPHRYKNRLMPLLASHQLLRSCCLASKRWYRGVQALGFRKLDLQCQREEPWESQNLITGWTPQGTKRHFQCTTGVRLRYPSLWIWALDSRHMHPGGKLRHFWCLESLNMYCSNGSISQK